MEASIEQHIDSKILDLMTSSNQLEKGLRLLMDTYQERLYWHIKGLVQQHQDTDDVLQNTFIKVYRNISSFKGDSQLYTWLYRIATNESLTLLKKRQKKGMASLDDEQKNIVVPLAEAQPDVNKIQQALNRALLELPSKQRAVFQMRYYDEMSYADMKDITGTSIGALKASYHHAVKKVEAFLRQV